MQAGPGHFGPTFTMFTAFAQVLVFKKWRTARTMIVTHPPTAMTRSGQKPDTVPNQLPSPCSLRKYGSSQGERWDGPVLGRHCAHTYCDPSGAWTEMTDSGVGG